jgi:hypothetical protein
MEHAIRIGVADIRTGAKDPVRGLREAVKNAYGVMDTEQNYVLFLYQEAKNLPTRYRKRILDVDRGYAAKFEDLLAQGIERQVFRADIDPFLVAQNILTLGHMWAFRRWLLRGQCTFEQFLDRQLDFILAAIVEDHKR